MVSWINILIKKDKIVLYRFALLTFSTDDDGLDQVAWI